MTNALIILIFWVVVIAIIWFAFRSRLFRESCEDIRAMHNAPENKSKSKEFEAYMADPIYQIVTDREKEEQRKN